jgi:hypothetical protein
MRRCFPHVVNLACQAVLKAITNMDFADELAEDYVPTATGERDPVAMIRTVVRVVSFFF